MSDPPGVDLASVRQTSTWAQWVAHVVLFVGLGLALLHPAVADALQLTSRLPVVLLLGFPLPMTVYCALRERAFVERPWIGRAFIAYTGAAIASIGACAAPAASPAYGFLLVVPAGWASLIPANPTAVITLVAAPPLLRAVAVPEATRGSIGVALAVGAVTAALYWALSLRFRAGQRAEARRVAQLALGAAGPAAGSDRWTALRLHDGLSGALMLARVRVATGAPGAADAARAAARQARALCDPEDAGAPADADTVTGDLATLAAYAGADVAIELTGAADAPWGEARELLIELIGNHARHGAGRLHVRARTRPGQLVVEVRGPGAGPLAAAPGRGRRNLELRVGALGGQVRWTRSRRGWAVAVELPRGGAPTARISAWVVEASIVASLPVIAWVATGNWLATAVFGAAALLTAALLIRNLAEDEQLRAARVAAVQAAIDAEAPEAARAARAALRAPVAQLESALAREDAAGIRAGVTALAETLHALLWQLEHREEAVSATRAARA